jgi:hypothetical protein
MGVAGDGFTSRIDPVGTGTSLRIWQGGNSGGVQRCQSNCTASGATWSTARGAWTGDTQSFVLPYDIFHGGISGGDDCSAAGIPGGCTHLLAGTTRVWETTTGGNSTSPTSIWHVSSPATCTGTNACVTKGNLGNRSYINQIKYSPKYQTVGILGTNDGNVQISVSLGGLVNTGSWVDVTGGNAVLPNRPILGICLDPSVGAANTPVGYAAVGGFNANFLPGGSQINGHVFQVTCTANCGSFNWVDKTGNLPDIPANTVAGVCRYGFRSLLHKRRHPGVPTLVSLRKRSPALDDLGYADRSRLHHAFGLDAGSRSLCLSSAEFGYSVRCRARVGVGCIAHDSSRSRRIRYPDASRRKRD